jgi:hypothetical protein
VSDAWKLRVPWQFRVEDKLGDAFAVAEVDEDAAAVVAIAGDPSEEHDEAALVGRAELATVMGPF